MRAFQRERIQVATMRCLPSLWRPLTWREHGQHRRCTITHRQCCDWAACISKQTAFVSAQLPLSNEQLRYVEDNRTELIPTQPTWTLSWAILHLVPQIQRLVWPRKEAIRHVHMNNWLHTCACGIRAVWLHCSGRIATVPMFLTIINVYSFTYRYKM